MGARVRIVLICLLRHDGCTDVRHVVDESAERDLRANDHGVVVDSLKAIGVNHAHDVGHVLRAFARRTLEAIDDIGSLHLFAVVELHALAQIELERLAVDDLPGFRKPRLQIAIGIVTHQLLKGRQQHLDGCAVAGFDRIERRRIGLRANDQIVVRLCGHRRHINVFGRESGSRRRGGRTGCVIRRPLAAAAAAQRHCARKHQGHDSGESFHVAHHFSFLSGDFGYETGLLNCAGLDGGTDSALSVAQLGIERVTKTVAKEVQGEDGHHDRQTRKDRHVGEVANVAFGRRDHRAPFRSRRLDAQAEEAQAGCRQDCEGDLKSCLHNDRR